MTAVGQAAGDRELLEDFLNTHHAHDARGRDHDLLSSVGLLRAWFVERGLLMPDEPVSDVDGQWAREVRDALRMLLAIHGHHGRVLDGEAGVQILNRAARRVRPIFVFDPAGRVRLESEASGVDGAIGRLLGLAAEAMRTGEWRRMKVCGNEGCGWAFYDHSKNQSAAWCGTSCGNLMKARAYRERHRAGRAG